jgi:GTPase SAR1 family protein
MSDDAFSQIESAAGSVKRLRTALGEIAEESQGYVWFNDLYLELRRIIDRLDKVRDELSHPCLKIAFVGTTSSGKSTLLNGLAGHRIAPMEAGEMSAGVVRIRNGANLSMNVLETQGMNWSSGNYSVRSDEDIYDALRDKERGVMERYWQAVKENAEVMAPQIEITVPLAPKNGGIPGFSMPPSLELEFYDLPGLKTVTDHRNLAVIQQHLAGSFLVVVLNYSDTDTDKRKKLLDEIKKTVLSICKNKEALVFVLNRIDERNSVDNPLEERMRELSSGIREALELAEAPEIIPMSALPLYHLQSAWGAEASPLYEKDPQKSVRHLANFFEDCPKIIRAIARGDGEKRSWFNEHHEENIDDWEADDVPNLRDWVYEYSGAGRFWEMLQKKLSGQIGAVVINPALGDSVDLLEKFSERLSGLLGVLNLSTEEEIRGEKERIETLTAQIKKKLSDFEEEFGKNFGESIEAFKSGEAARIQRSKYAPQFSPLRGVLRQIRDDVYDTIMVPIRDTLAAADADKLEYMEEKLAEVVPDKLANDIKRAANQLLIEGYGDYAEKGYVFECPEDQLGEHTSEKVKLEKIQNRHNALSHYVDEALLCRCRLLLQEKLRFFEEKAQEIVQSSAQELGGQLIEQIGMGTGVEMNTLLVPPASTGRQRELSLPSKVFNLSIEGAQTRMKTIKEKKTKRRKIN